MTKKFTYIIIGIAVLATLILLALFNPSDSGWILQCPFHFFTGYQCPGCGMQRAIHACFHGHFAQALAYNYFFILAIPYALILSFISIAGGPYRFPRLYHTLYGSRALYIFIFIYFVWWIFRNIYHL